MHKFLKKYQLFVESFIIFVQPINPNIPSIFHCFLYIFQHFRRILSDFADFSALYTVSGVSGTVFQHNPHCPVRTISWIP